MGNTQWVVMYAAMDGNYTTDRSKAVHGTNLICFGRVPDRFVQRADHPITVIAPDSLIAQFLDEHSAMIAKEKREQEQARRAGATDTS